jgi:nicotinamidase-related amidase
MKPALLVIDLQKVYCDRDPTRRELSVAAAKQANAAAELFRGKEFPVVAVYHRSRGGPGPGDPAYEFIDAVDIGKPDVRIDKTKGNAFAGTDLEARLRALGVDTVILAGYCAEHCVLSTARGADDLGFPAIVLRGALASGRSDHIEFVERIEESVTLGALEALLER